MGEYVNEAILFKEPLASEDLRLCCVELPIPDIGNQKGDKYLSALEVSRTAFVCECKLVPAPWLRDSVCIRRRMPVHRFL